METQESKVIYSFPKGNGEELQISLRNFKDKYYIDLRVWYQSKSDQNFLPTKKGICLTLDKIPELYKGVDRAMKLVDKLESSEPISS